jgi:hypothetical protein
MRLTAIIDRMDDWINPIVVKELRQAVKSRAVIAILLIFLGLQLFLVGLYLFIRMQQGLGEIAELTAGREIFMVLQAMLIITLMLLVPAYACIRLAGERSDHNVDLLFISTLRPHSIIAGKFFAALMLALLVFSATAPFMTFAYLMRGIDIPTIMLVVGIDVLCMLFGTMAALFLASLPGTRVIKIFACLVGFVGLFIPCMVLVNGTLFMISRGENLTASNVFWAVVAGITLPALGAVGLFFFYAVALVSPHSSNRSLPLRVYILSVWLLTGLAVLLLPLWSPATFHLAVGLPIWMTVSVVVLGLQMLISVCERDSWGQRVARTIPQSRWLRLPLFFLYTGSAGGLAYTVILLGVTFGVAAWWMHEHEGTPEHQVVAAMFAALLAAVGYLYNYGLSAILVRIYLLSGQVKQAFTWVIALLLLGLGSSIPALIAFLIFPDQVRVGNEGYWWKLPSPFLTVAEVFPSHPGARVDDAFVEACSWFLGVWAVLVTLAALPWFVGQVRRFHPLPRREPVVAELADTEEAEVVPVPPEVNGAAGEAEPVKDETPSEQITSIQPG